MLIALCVLLCVIWWGCPMPEALTFEQRRKAAIAILVNGERLSRKAGSLLGQIAVDPTPLTEKQDSWFRILAERAGIDLEAE